MAADPLHDFGTNSIRIRRLILGECSGFERRGDLADGAPTSESLRPRSRFAAGPNEKPFFETTAMPGLYPGDRTRNSLRAARSLEVEQRRQLGPIGADILGLQLRAEADTNANVAAIVLSIGWA